MKNKKTARKVPESIVPARPSPFRNHGIRRKKFQYSEALL
ncbi:hypothetical protein HM1_0066 [Heliomicrobium modesticaldum Ice1]|uniref:Uncharacterized protein n=1 Tax=Heliobacterium modesticaldum (strain ATCC 51547 / Ice1) TaxID=498761 RepID=B0TI18_HELMI|nr:hypothetical protein HM1_0066 [Heliomicrobium modesticaldum Ice1]